MTLKNLLNRLEKLEQLSRTNEETQDDVIVAFVEMMQYIFCFPELGIEEQIQELSYPFEFKEFFTNPEFRREVKKILEGSDKQLQG